jgi:HAD domain in Swiss Army Knife RNA repair proteins
VAIVLFLNIDGCLRRTSAPKYQLEGHLVENLERFVADLERKEPVRIVITSTWKTAIGLDEIRSRFTPSLRIKIVGATPSFPASDGSRHQEILTYLRLNGLERAKWIAIDDDPFGFPPNPENLILVDPEEGFTFAPAREA